MSASALATEATHSDARLFEPKRSTLEGRTLEDMTLETIILGAWEDLGMRGRAECPVCAGELVAAGCTNCGSELS